MRPDLVSLGRPSSHCGQADARRGTEPKFVTDMHFSSQDGSAVGRWETRKDPVVDLEGKFRVIMTVRNVKRVDASG
jgi:hypothetical protein